MGHKSKARKGNHGRRSNPKDSSEDVMPFNSDGSIPNGFTISFTDLEADFLDDDEQQDAPRGGYGSQVLPVALHLPDDFAGEPGDGDEYLFLVR